MSPGHKYLSWWWLLSVKMCNSLQISSTFTLCLLPSLLREVLYWMICRAYLRHFASCLDCHMLCIWITLKPWKTHLASKTNAWLGREQTPTKTAKSKKSLVELECKCTSGDIWQISLVHEWIQLFSSFLLFTTLRLSTQTVSPWVHWKATRGCRSTYIHSHICEIHWQSLTFSGFCAHWM